MKFSSFIDYKQILIETKSTQIVVFINFIINILKFHVALILI